MTRVETVVFDIDGTLLDTREFIFGSYENTLQKFNLPEKSREEIARQVGHNLETCYSNLAPGEELEPLIKSHRKFQRENYELIKPYPGSNKILEQLKEQKIKIGLWTGRSQTVMDSLESAGIGPELYDCVVDADMYDASKPDPEGFLMTLDKLSADAASAVMIGDSKMDIEAGKRGGALATVAVTHGFGTAEALEEAGADYIIDSLAEITDIIDGAEQQNV